MTLAQVRRYALALAGATEEPHFERTSFRVVGRILVTARTEDTHVHVFRHAREACRPRVRDSSGVGSRSLEWEQFVETPKPEFAFTVFCLLDRMDVIGPSNNGLLRRFPIRSGTIEGPGIRGEVLPGGADWQTVRRDGGLLLEAKYSFRTDDGVLVQVCNRGLAWLPGATSWEGPYPPTRTAAQFIAPDGKYDWLNRYIFVSSVDVPPEPIDRAWIHFFKLL